MKVLKSISKYLQYLSAVALVVMMALVVINISGRVFFGRPLGGAAELCAYMLLLIVAFGIAAAATLRQHIKVDLVMDRLSKKTQLVIDTFVLILSFVMLGIMTWGTGTIAMMAPRYTPVLHIPDTPFRWIFTIGWGFCCIASLALIIENFQKRGKDGS